MTDANKNANQAPVSIRPRIYCVLPDGGHGEPLTGGFNIRPVLMPTSMHQRCPWKYSPYAALLAKIQEAAKDELGINDQNSDVSFQMWLRAQPKAHQQLGMDNIFKIPNYE